MEDQFAEDGYIGSSTGPALRMLQGDVPIIISSPHAVKHPREGRSKSAEMILYPCLRVDRSLVKRKIVRNIPPRLISPLRMNTFYLKIKSYFCTNMTSKTKSLRDFSSQLAIDTL